MKNYYLDSELETIKNCIIDNENEENNKKLSFPNNLKQLFNLSTNKGKKLYLGKKENWIIDNETEKLTILYDNDKQITSYLRATSADGSYLFFMTNGHKFHVFYEEINNKFGFAEGKDKFYFGEVRWV